MKFIKTTNTNHINGTSYKGLFIRATLSDIEKVFGKPVDGDGYKTNYEWMLIRNAIIDSNGNDNGEPLDGEELELDEKIVKQVFCIYDYKEDECDVQDDVVIDWNVGTKNLTNESLYEYFVDKGLKPFIR